MANLTTTLAPIRRSSAGLVAVVALAMTSCGSQAPESFALRGERIYPEGIGVDHSNGDFYVSSSRDGSIHRGNVEREDTEVFLPGEQDGRDAATGVKVDDQGRLWVAGRFTGRAFVYDTESGRLIKALTTPATERTLINDLTFTPDAAFFTDSFRPILWRVGRTPDGVGEMEPWLDLRETVVPTDTEFGLNGISASDDGRTLVTVHFDSGRLFRIDVATRQVSEIDLSGVTLPTGDGILLDGRTLLVVREEPGAVFPVRLAEDLASGEVGEPFGEDFRFPTTLAEYAGRVLVVNSQFDRGGFPATGGQPAAPAPDLPFTVSSVEVPDRVQLGS